MKRLLCLLMALVALCMCGCGADEQSGGDTTGATEIIPTLPDYHFSKMEYMRPDTEKILSAQEKCTDLIHGDDWPVLNEAFSEYRQLYNTYETMYNLASIHYHLDLTDTYWEAEYQFCSEGMVSIQAVEYNCLHALAQSQYAERFEQTYADEVDLSLYSDEFFLTTEFTGLRREEQGLIEQYYSLSAASASPEEMAQLLAQLVLVRQKQATLAGYESYADFGYYYVQGRDYTRQEAQSYLEQVRREIAPLYRKLQSNTQITVQCSSNGPYAYVKALAEDMGGTVAEAFGLMETGQLYDIGVSETKLPNTAYMAYLNDYGVPYVYMNMRGNGAAITFAHEFGHFCNAYAGGGMKLNKDTAEVFSQGMEYLGICYGECTMKQTQLFSLLNTYVTSAAAADFELRLYGLPEEEVTAQNIAKLYSQVGNEWGLTYTIGFSANGFAGTMQYYVDPMYMFSYVISSDVALQFYEMEQKEPGCGLRTYEASLTTKEEKLLSFVKEAGMRSPFAPGRVQEVRDAFTKGFQE